MTPGKAGRAPCGHDGEHILGGYIRCHKGCDETAWEPTEPLWDVDWVLADQCLHPLPLRYWDLGRAFCKACGKQTA